MIELLTEFDAQYLFLGNDGSTFYVQTDRDAPRSRIVSFDVTDDAADTKRWKTLVAEAPDALEAASLVGDTLLVSYLHNAHSEVKRFALDGKSLGTIELPGLGTAGGFGGRRGDRETFYSFTSFTTPASIYRFDLEGGKSTSFRQPKTAFRPDEFETKQVFYPSRDGTKIPMFLVGKRGMKPKPSTPTLLYGYGGFDISITPTFSPSNILWMELGGLYAVANLRGGGEYGRAWHEAGMKTRKQNVFDDFISAAEWLQVQGYTSRDKLAITGRSNGGLLVGACMTQRPTYSARRARGRCTRHAAVPPLHDRMGLGFRVRLGRQRRRVPYALGLLPAAQLEVRHRLSGDDDRHSRPRRPGGARP